MFKAVFELETIAECPTLKEACRAIYYAVIQAIEKGTSWQVLETAVWIEEPGSKFPLMFYDIRDRACDNGWIVDGEWVG